MDLPEMDDPANLKASLENGILSVAVAKDGEYLFRSANREEIVVPVRRAEVCGIIGA